jgi:hypothetical protein
MNQSPGEWREYGRLVLAELERLTNEQEKVNIKLDMILNKYWMLVGMASAISTVFGIIIHFALKGS